jgi:hypothetical protein
MQEGTLSESVPYFCNLRCTGRLGVVVRRVAQDVSEVAKATGREAGGEERAKRGGEGEGSAVYVWVDDVLSLQAPPHVHKHSARRQLLENVGKHLLGAYASWKGTQSVSLSWWRRRRRREEEEEEDVSKAIAVKEEYERDHATLE